MATRKRRRTPIVKVQPKDKGYDVAGQRKRNATYADNQADKGLVKCTVWVPTDYRDDLIAYAGELRGE